MTSPTPEPEPEPRASPLLELVRRHLRFGWIALLVFATLGGVLELLHAFKSAAYLGVGSEIRRSMWTLAHAHGIGLSLLHLGFAGTLRLGFEATTARLALAGGLLRWATLLLPAGFFLGGITSHRGDPGAGIWLVPIGAGLVWIGALVVAFELTAARR